MICLDRETFKENLLRALSKIPEYKDKASSKECKFTVVPVEENGKSYNSKDDMMRLWVLSEKNLLNRYLDLEGIVKMFSGLEPLYPLWIDVHVKENSEECIVIELKTSLRFRKPSELKNQEEGYPPFKVVN